MVADSLPTWALYRPKLNPQVTLAVLRGVQNSVKEWKLIAISQSYGHHAKGSGYAELTSHVNFDSICLPSTGKIAKKYDQFINRAGQNRLISRFTRRRVSTEIRFLFASNRLMPKLVHVLYGEHHSWLLRLMRSSNRSRKVMTIHLPPSLWHVSFKRGQLDRFDGVILMSHSQLDPLKDDLGYEGQIKVIPHGVDTERFAFKSRSKPVDKIVCIMVGNFLRDYDALARIALEARQSTVPIEFHVVASKAAAQPLLELENVTVHHGISDAALLDLYYRSQLGVFTMTDCTANNAILEAMATGLPIVTHDIGGVRTYVDDQCATFFDISSPESAIQAIHAAVVDYEARSNAARAKAEQMDWPIIASQTLEFYRDTIS